MKDLPDTRGFDERERLAWEKLAAAAEALLGLRKVHVNEHAEAVTHIHALQVALLARLAYPVIARADVG